MSGNYIAYQPPRFYEALKAEGFTLPDGCGDIELSMPVDGVVQMKLLVIMTDELLGQIGRALARIAAENIQAEDEPMMWWAVAVLRALCIIVIIGRLVWELELATTDDPLGRRVRWASRPIDSVPAYRFACFCMALLYAGILWLIWR